MAAPNRTLAPCAKGGCNGAPPSLYGVEIMKKILFVLAALVGLGTPAYAQEQEERVVTVKAGDTLSKIAGRNWRAVCKANALPDCTKIRVGQTIRLDATSAPEEAPQATGNRDAEGYFLWREVGIRNMRIYQGSELVRHSQVLSMRKSGLSEVEISEVVTAINNGTAEEGVMETGMRFDVVSYSTSRGVELVRKVKYVGRESHRIWRVRTSTGRVFTIIEKCDNFAIEEAPPPPPVIERPPPPVEVPPAPPPPVDIPPPPAAKKFCENIRLNLVVGAEVEIDPARAWSLYGAWGVYCMQKLRDGEIGFGLGGQHARYGSGPGNGKFRGGFDGVGPSVMRVWDRGQDLEAKLMFGKYWSDYRETDYRSRERADVLAMSVAHNDYSGRVDGSGRPERQIFALAAIPVGGSSGEWWQGNKISEGSHLQAYLNFGVRQYLQKEDPDRPWNLYAQVGGLAELRSGDDYFSCSFRLGATNKRRTFGIHAGINTCNGGIIPAIGAWYDLGNDLAKSRADRRLAAVSNDNGEGRKATTTFAGRRLAMTRE